MYALRSGYLNTSYNTQDAGLKSSYSNESLIFIEVQTGDYFGEDDIIRYEDDYGRSN